MQNFNFSNSFLNYYSFPPIPEGRQFVVVIAFFSIIVHYALGFCPLYCIFAYAVHPLILFSKKKTVEKS